MLLLAGCNRTGNEQAPAGNAQAGGVPARGLPPARASSPPAFNIDRAGAVNACLSPQDQARPLSQFTREQRLAMLTCINAQAARAINNQLPRQIDSVTRLDRLVADGPTLTYSYTITRRRAELPADIARQLDRRIRADACTEPRLREIVGLGGAYTYRWVDSSGALIQESRIDAC